MSTPENSLFTPRDEVLAPDEQVAVLEQALTQTDAGPPDVVVTEQPVPPPGRSWAFDFREGGFKPGMRASNLAIRGVDTLKAWVEKCLRTDRGAYPIHSDDYGMQRPFDLIGEPVSTATTVDLEHRISDALTFHPLIVAVADFQMESDPDDEAVFVSFAVVLSDDSSIPLELQLP